MNWLRACEQRQTTKRNGYVFFDRNWILGIRLACSLLALVFACAFSFAAVRKEKGGEGEREARLAHYVHHLNY
jgi:hypothetical protein